MKEHFNKLVESKSKLTKDATYVAYKRWELVVEGMLDEEDLWNEEKEEPVQSEPGKKEDKKARRILISLIDDKFLNELEEAETAHDLYCEIWYRFQKKARKEGCKARRQLYSREYKRRCLVVICLLI